MEDLFTPLLVSDLLELHACYEQQLTLAIVQGNRHAMIHYMLKLAAVEHGIRRIDE